MKLTDKLSTILRLLPDLIFPPVCLNCGCSLFGHSEHYLCTDCHQSFKLIDSNSCWYCAKPLGKYSARLKHCSECQSNNHSYTRVIAASTYCSPAKELIHAFKFNNCRNIYKLIAEMMLTRINEEYSNQKFDYIIPVPLHKQKHYERGYNQSALVASSLAKRLEIQYSDKLLLRKRYTVSQSSLTATERKANLTDAFAAPELLDKKSILLIDDIFTTGSTINECAKTLRNSGVRRVYAAVFAR